MTDRARIAQAIAPTGTLRVAINQGNAVIGRSQTQTEQPAGVAVDLARALAGELGLQVTLQTFSSAGEAVTALTDGQADLGFIAIDPARSGLHFSAAYALIEGAYLVPQDSPLQHNDQVDRPGTRIAAGQASAYDLYLTRALRHATLVRIPPGHSVPEAMLHQGLPVAGGVRQQLEADARRLPGVRLLPGHFMVIAQAAALPQTRDPQAHAWLDDFIERMKATGFVAQALTRHGIEGVTVAPAGR